MNKKQTKYKIKIDIEYIPSEWIMDEDGEWKCEHNFYTTYKEEEPYFNNDGAIDSREYLVAVCDQCGKTGSVKKYQDEYDISYEIYWDND